MPEEINRIVTDSIADYLWTSSPDGDENLLREGIAPEKIRRVGNIMIDSLVMMTPAIQEDGKRHELGLEPGTYGIVTLHRPSNVDNAEKLKSIVDTLVRISQNIPLVFPVHPRTRKQLELFSLMKALGNCSAMTLLEPLGYKAFMNIVLDCKLVITDSGGLQEETSYIGIPCLTLRPNTERPITVDEGTNILSTPERLEQDVAVIDCNACTEKKGIEFWDGKTAVRVVKAIKSIWG